MRDFSNVTHPFFPPVHWGAWLFALPLVLTAWLFPQGWEPQRRGAVKALLLGLLWLWLPTSAQTQWTNMEGPNAPISGISIAGDSLYVAGSGIFLYDGNTRQWLPKGPENASYFSIEANPEEHSILFAERDTDFGWRYLDRSIDGGTNWEWTGLGGSPEFIPIAISPSNPNRVYAGRWRSDDQGASWDSIATPIQGRGVIAVHPMHKDNLFLATGVGVYKSLDGGASWDTLDLSGGSVLAIDPGNGDIVYVGVQNIGMFKSTDGGIQWTSIDSGLTNLNFVDLVVDPNNSDHLYAATYGGGIYHSKNGGLEWQTLNDALPSLDVGALALSTRKIYVGFSEYEGLVYQRDSESSLHTHQNSTKPDAFGLSPNYPNPFNPNTTLRFETPRQGRVELIVYDLRGREVVRLLDRHMPPGYFDVIWNGTTATGAPIASGMYFARMVTPDYSRTIKMILLK